MNDKMLFLFDVDGTPVSYTHLDVYKRQSKALAKGVDVTEDPFNVYITGIDTCLLYTSLVMALDNQQRNLKPKEVFGDYQQFCDEISRNAVKETTIEKVGLYGGLLCIFITLLFLIGIFNNHGEIRFTADELIPVSYTHLDVYKRQLLNNV